MKRHLALIIVIVALAQGSPHVFSVHDDIHAFPQYDVIFSDSFISEAEASSRLAFAAAASKSTSRATRARPDAAGSTPASDGAVPAEEHRPETTQTTAGAEQVVLGISGAGQADDGPTTAPPASGGDWRMMWHSDQRYLCSIPAVETPVRNETADGLARAAEEKELARATTRGWELLREMQGTCMYFHSGWWSYQFCHNALVKQFHALPPVKGASGYPPVEDRNTAAYLLGRAVHDGDDDGGRKPGPGQRSPAPGEITLRSRAGGEAASTTTTTTTTAAEMHVKGDMRYLVQKLGAGTTCDLTGKERRIEVQRRPVLRRAQYHCRPQSSDQIGWIKEVTTCAYLMVIYTPRLCHDAAFLPPQTKRAHAITCQEVLSPDLMEAWKVHLSEDAQRRLLASKDGGEDGGVAAAAAAAATTAATAATAADDGPGSRKPSDTKHAGHHALTVGGVQVGARRHVGTEGRRIETGGLGDTPAIATGPGGGADANAEADANANPQGNGQPAAVAGDETTYDDDDESYDDDDDGAGAGEEMVLEIVARSSGGGKGKSNGHGDGGNAADVQDMIHRLSDEDLRRLNLDPDAIAALKRELQHLAAEKGWTLEVVEVAHAPGHGGGSAAEPEPERGMVGAGDGVDDGDDDDGGGGDGGDGGGGETDGDGDGYPGPGRPGSEEGYYYD
ncbi:MAG: Protein OS-9 [Phylliscum demangeonii]|nr:MAG: Protein OS-9 [Phylliscum demangeonii]